MTGLREKKIINLSTNHIIREDDQIGDAGVQLLCSQPLSHITKLYLSRMIDNKMATKSVIRGCFTSQGLTGKILFISN
jgi:hypothetical protein